MKPWELEEVEPAKQTEQPRVITDPRFLLPITSDGFGRRLGKALYVPTPGGGWRRLEGNDVPSWSDRDVFFD